MTASSENWGQVPGQFEQFTTEERRYSAAPIGAARYRLRAKASTPARSAARICPRAMRRSSSAVCLAPGLRPRANEVVRANKAPGRSPLLPVRSYVGPPSSPAAKRPHAAAMSCPEIETGLPAWRLNTMKP